MSSNPHGYTLAIPTHGQQHPETDDGSPRIGSARNSGRGSTSTGGGHTVEQGHRIGNVPKDPQDESLGGVGLVFVEGVAPGRIGVLTLTSNGPAERDGRVLVGDLVKAVEGKNVVGMQLTQIRKLIVGEPGTTCTLVFDRPSTNTAYSVALVRESQFQTKNKIIVLQQKITELQTTLVEERSRRTHFESQFASLQQHSQLLRNELETMKASGSSRSVLESETWEVRLSEALARASAAESNATEYRGVVDELHAELDRERHRCSVSEGEAQRLRQLGEQLRQDVTTLQRQLKEEAVRESAKVREDSQRDAQRRERLLSDLSSELERERERAGRAEVEVDKMGAIVDQLRAELDTWRTRFAELSEETKNIRKERDGAVDKARLSLESEVDDLRHRLADAEDKNFNLKLQSDQLHDRFDAETARLRDEHAATVAEWKKRVESERGRAQNQSQLEIELKTAHNKLRSLDESSSNKIRQLEIDMHSLAEQLKNEKYVGKQIRDESEQAQRRVVDLENLIKNLERKLSEGKSEVEQIRSESRFEIDRAREMLIAANSKEEGLLETVERLKTKLRREEEARQLFATDLQNDAEKNINQLEQRMSQLVDERERISVQLEDAIGQLHGAVQALDREKEKVHSISQAFDREKDLRASAENRARTIAERFADIEKKYQALEVETNENVRVVEEYKVVIVKLETKCNQFEERYRERDAVSHRLEEIVRERETVIEGLSQREAKLQHEHGHCLKRLETCERELQHASKLVHELSNTVKEFSVLKEKHGGLAERCRELEGMAAKGREFEARFRDADGKAREFEGRFRELETKLRELEGIFTAQQHELSNSQKQNAALAAQLKGAHGEILKLENALRGTDVELRSADEEVRRVDAARRATKEQLEQTVAGLHRELEEQKQILKIKMGEAEQIILQLQRERDESQKMFKAKLGEAVEKMGHADQIISKLERDNEELNRIHQIKMAEGQEHFRGLEEKHRAVQQQHARQMEELRRRIEHDEVAAKEAISKYKDRVHELTSALTQIDHERRGVNDQFRHQTQIMETQIVELSEKLQREQVYIQNEELHKRKILRDMEDLQKEIDHLKIELFNEKQSRIESAHRHAEINQRVVAAANEQIFNIERGYVESLQAESSRNLLSHSFDSASHHSLSHSHSHSHLSHAHPIRSLSLSKTFDGASLPIAATSQSMHHSDRGGISAPSPSGSMPSRSTPLNTPRSNGGSNNNVRSFQPPNLRVR